MPGCGMQSGPKLAFSGFSDKPTKSKLKNKNKKYTALKSLAFERSKTALACHIELKKK